MEHEKDTLGVIAQGISETDARTEIDSRSLCVYDPLPFPSINTYMADKNPVTAVADQLKIPHWARLFFWIFGLLVLALGAWVWSAQGHLTQIDGELSQMPIQISRDLLSQAKADAAGGDAARAARATEAATALISQATVKRLEAKPEFFFDAIADLNIVGRVFADSTPETRANVDAKVLTARTVLADYRSALEPSITLTGSQTERAAAYGLGKENRRVDPQTLNAPVWKASSGSADFLNNLLPTRRLEDHLIVDHVSFIGGAQSLDGFQFYDTAFINMLVKYQGGEVVLENVKFVNCTFQLGNGARSKRVADYVALGQTKLTIGPDSPN